MSPRPGTNGTFTINADGAVSGAVTDFYRNSDSNVSLTWSPAISGPVGNWAGGYDHPNFRETDINLFSITGGTGVVSGDFSGTWLASGGFQFSAGAHAIVGGDVSLSMPILWRPSTWDISTNASGRAAVGLNVGAFGFGIGGVFEGTIDDGRAGINGTYDLVILGVNAGYGTQYPLSTGSGNNSNRQPNTPRPSDEAIQTSRDIVAGKLVDAFTGQIVYADAIIRGVAAAKKKREQEIAEAAAWQREHNRDRTDGGSSSSSSGSSSNSNNGRVHIPPGTPNHLRVAGVSYGGQDADARREGGAHGTPTYDNHADRLGHPIVIDLDDDGVEISPLGGSTARFDYDNDGFKELTAWVGKDDGLLVYDIGNDGLITETREVVIAEWTADTTDMDLEALKAVFDTNNDGILNANDTALANSKIWNDTDQDGRVYTNRRVRAITPPTPNVPIAALIRANPLDRPLILPRYI